MFVCFKEQRKVWLVGGVRLFWVEFSIIIIIIIVMFWELQTFKKHNKRFSTYSMCVSVLCLDGGVY